MERHRVEVFKTNVRRKREAKRLLDILAGHFPACRINFDLEDCDNILRVAGKEICNEKIARLVGENGYECDVLK